MLSVSVIIPACNVGLYVASTIESCINQSLKDIEIIVVNDGSTDNTKEIIEDYAVKDSRIIAIHKKNEGVTIARQTGLNIAKGEYIFFLDGDDYLEVTALKNIYDEAKLKNADFVVGDFRFVYPDGKIIEKNFFDFKETDSIGFMKYCFLKSDFYFTGRLIKRKLLEIAELNIPATITFGEDNVAVIQLAAHLQKAIKVNTIVLYYVQRTSSVTNMLKKEDLIQRSNACWFTLQYVKNSGFYNKMQLEIEIFMLHEICAGIARGYLDNRFLSFLKLPFITEKKYNEHLSIKKKFLLSLASVNTGLTVFLYNTITRIIHRRASE